MCRLAAQIRGGGVVNGFSFKRLEERKLNSVYQLHLLNVSAARGNPKINIKTRTTKEEALMTGEQHPIPALTPPNCHLNSAYNKRQVLLVSHPAHNPP